MDALDHDAFNMHALVVRERILGPAHELTKQRTVKRAQRYADEAMRAQDGSDMKAARLAVLLWVRALNLGLKNDKPIDAFLRWQLKMNRAKRTPQLDSVSSNQEALFHLY